MHAWLGRLLPLLLVGSAAAAQEARPVTLDEVLRVARDRSRDLQAAREHLQQVSADIDRAWSLLLPTLSLQGKYTRNSQQSTFDLSGQANQFELQGAAVADVVAAMGPGVRAALNDFAARKVCAAADQTCAAQILGLSASGGQPGGTAFFQRFDQLDFAANASVPLILPYAYLQLRASRQALIAQEKNADATAATILTNVASSFFAAAGNDELVAARRHGVEVAQKTLDDARARLEAGVVNPVDVNRAEQALVRAVQALREAEDGAESAHRALRTIAQLDEPFRVVPAEEPPPVAAPVEGLVAGALRLRPEILVIDRQVDSAGASLGSNKLKWAPSLSAFGRLLATNAQGFSPHLYTWAVGLQLDWLVYDGGLHQAAERQFASAARESALRRAQLRDQIADEVANLHRGLETRRRAVDSARRDADLSRRTLELVRIQYQAGTATQLDLLNAQDALVNAEVNLARARFDLGLNDVQLRRAAGLFPDVARN